jgi:hypothetical protein
VKIHAEAAAAVADDHGDGLSPPDYHRLPLHAVDDDDKCLLYSEVLPCLSLAIYVKGRERKERKGKDDR